MVAVVGKPDVLTVMSEPVTANDDVAVLFEVTGSFVAPVVPVSVTVPTTVGVPVTEQLIDAPGATVVGGVGVQVVVSPAGRPAIAHVALVAAIAGAAALVHVNDPV